MNVCVCLGFPALFVIFVLFFFLNGLVLKDYFPRCMDIHEFLLQTEFPFSAFIQVLYADKELKSN